MNRIAAVILACTLILTGAGHHPVRAGEITPDLLDLMDSLAPDAEVPVIITFADKVDPHQFRNRNKSLRRNRLIRALKYKAKKSQKHLQRYLQQNNARKIKPFWIFNGMAVTARKDVIKKLAGMTGIESIRPDVVFSLEVPPAVQSTSALQWNITAIRAPELWGQGYAGSGIVVANMDTGVDYLHPDLAEKWRGGANSWFDPYGEHATPYDNAGSYSGHGTRVMGVMVGGDAGGTAIGVAPEAQWIAVKIFNDEGLAYSSIIHEGFQWLLDPDGNPATDDAPDVINNSWGFSLQQGQCNIDTLIQSDIQTLKAADIGVVFSAGNGGPNLNTSESPANYPESFAVGAVDETLGIAYFSARGPSACDLSFYPEVVAPGVGIYTADLTYNGTYPNSYATVEGTSFAAPHVAGAIALLLSAYPSLSIAEIEAALTASALDLGESGPDNDYGYGFLDVMEAATSLEPLVLNLPPVANNDTVTIPRNQSVIISVLANDMDPDGDIDAASVVLASATTTRGAMIAVNQDGTVTYDPGETGGGPDYFWYTVNDNLGATSNEARVRINRVRDSADPIPLPTGTRIRRR